MMNEYIVLVNADEDALASSCVARRRPPPRPHKEARKRVRAIRETDRRGDLAAFFVGIDKNNMLPTINETAG